MATRNDIPMLVDVYRNNNSTSRMFGKCYGRVFPREGLNLKGFARHLADHGKLASYEMLVLQNTVECMKHLLCEGVPIKLDGLGTFSAGIVNKRGGVDRPQDYSVANIDGIKMNFRPEGAGEPDERLTKKALLDICKFKMNDFVEVMKSEELDAEGNNKTYQRRTPLSQYALAQAQGDDDPQP